jgi:SAM-dependent methyltransferase
MPCCRSLARGSAWRGRCRGRRAFSICCGTGRITRQLTELGYDVTAVDESAEMLARVEHGVERVCAAIEGLELDRRFDVALLASNLVAAPPRQRQAFLETCRRHSDLVVVEGLPLGWRPAEKDRTSAESSAACAARGSRAPWFTVRCTTAQARASGHTRSRCTFLPIVSSWTPRSPRPGFDSNAGSMARAVAGCSRSRADRPARCRIRRFRQPRAGSCEGARRMSSTPRSALTATRSCRPE